jgi:hypothetical protein
VCSQAVSSIVAGEEVLELVKLGQDPGDEFSGRLASVPMCICEGTICKGLGSARGKGALSLSRPTPRLLYPFQKTDGTDVASVSSKRHDSMPSIVPVVWDPFRKVALPLMSTFDMRDECDSEDTLDLFEFIRDIARLPLDREAGSPAGVQAVSLTWVRSSLVPLGVVCPDVMMYSSASPECDDPLSGKSWKFCGPSTETPHDEPFNRSVVGSVCANENMPEVGGTMDWE